MSTLDFSRDMRYYIGTVYFVFLSLSLSLSLPLFLHTLITTSVKDDAREFGYHPKVLGDRRRCSVSEAHHIRMHVAQAGAHQARHLGHDKERQMGAQDIRPQSYEH